MPYISTCGTTTLRAPNSITESERLKALPRLPRDEGEPVFAEREPDDGSHYYDHWLAALEHLVTAKGLADSATLVARKEAWADAYRSTPHGMPVKLARGSDG